MTTTPLEYAHPTRADHAASPRAWRITAVLALIYALALAIAYVVLGGVRGFSGMFDGLPLGRPLVIVFLTSIFLIPGLALTDLLVVIGAVAGARGRSPRPWFGLYLILAIAGIVLQWTCIAAMILHGPISVILTTSSSISIDITPDQAPQVLLSQLIVALPAFLLLIPRLRRAALSGNPGVNSSAGKPSTD